MFDWNDLRYVLAIARGGSLAAAARSLSVNHSTVFRRLAAFEDALGVRLFERLPEGYVLTAEGEAIRTHAEQVEQSIHALERAVAGSDFRLSGDVRITTAPNLASAYIARYLPAFRALHPDIRVEIAAADSDFDLARREADLALRATAQPPDHLVGRKVVDLPWLACASRAYVDAHGRPRTMDDLAAHALIGADARFSRLPVFAWLHARHPYERFVVRAGDLNTMAALAAAGIGIALLPADQADDALVQLFAIEPPFASPLWLLTHPDLRHVARIKALADFLYECLRADPRLRAHAIVSAAKPAQRVRRAR
ncbi:LysR family transcriptional regulator, partial [Dokdonella sp.]|uniref:LysR family transcriptional regulator n=1 Tax=Dokdonella sp. TaxID=2291710 RepID=UPI002F3EEB4C